ncbi:MAG: hypothetical protein ACRC28_18580 [Clostridium sp.]|uniref:hypothetical protein n=1 Tax=Clostridium sp. TaxID=1506 RepID=UPI003F3A2FF7
MEIKQLNNKATIVGTVKKNEMKIVKYTQTKDGQTAEREKIMGNLLLEVKDGNKVNSIRVNIFCYDGNKVFTGLKTVKETVTPGMRVSVEGSVGVNRYKNKSGQLMIINTIDGKFIHRLTELDDKQDVARIDLEAYIEGFEEKNNEMGLPTGEATLKALSSGYKGRPIEIVNCFVDKESLPTAKNIMYAGSTMIITMKINNYMIVEEKQEEVSALGFGVQPKSFDSVKKEFVNNYQLVGCQQIPNMERHLRQEEVQELKRNIQVANASAMTKTVQATKPTQGAPSQEAPKQTTFGGATSGFDTQPSFTPVNDDDMPF